MAVALDGHEVGDFDRAVFRYAADIVAGKIDEHEVLRALFGIGHEVVGIGVVLFDGRSSAAGAGDGADFHEVAGEAHMDFGRTADERVSAGTAEAEHVGRGIHEPQGAVEIQRVAGEIRLEPLREDDLEDVPGADVFLRAVDHGVVFLAGGVRRGGRGGGGGFGENGIESERSAEVFQDALNPRRGCVIGRAGVALVWENIRDNSNSAAAVVEDDNRLCDHEKHVGDAEFVFWRSGDGWLEPADAIVAEVAHGAAEERSDRGVGRHAIGRHPFLQFIERIARGLERTVRAAFADGDVFSCGGECGLRAEAEERVAADLVALLGGLEEEGWGLAA